MEEVEEGYPVDERRRHEWARDAANVDSVRNGAPAVFGAIFDDWVDAVFDVAFHLMRRWEDAFEVTCRAFETAWRRLPGLEPPEALGVWLLGITRDAAIERNPDAVAGIPEPPVPFGDTDEHPALALPPGDPLARAGTVADVMRDGAAVALLWGAGRTLAARDLSVLDLCLRHRFTPGEAAAAVGLRNDGAEALVEELCRQIDVGVRAVVLFNGGSPKCEVLAERLEASQLVDFDIHTARLIARHAEDCRSCRVLEDLAVEPVTLFGSIPLTVMDERGISDAAAALSVLGVPLGASRYAAAGLARAGSGAAAGPVPPGEPAAGGPLDELDGLPPPPPLPPPPVPLPVTELVTAGERRRRRHAKLLAFGAGAAVVGAAGLLWLVVLGAGAILRTTTSVESAQGGSHRHVPADPEPTTTTTLAGAIGGTTVPSETVPPETSPESSTSSVPGGPTTTRAAVTPGPRPTTRPNSNPPVTFPNIVVNTPTLTHDQIVFELNGASTLRLGSGWHDGSGPTLRWAVPDQGATVEVTGYGIPRTVAGPVGSIRDVCPVEPGGGVCSPPSENYMYHLVVTDSTSAKHEVHAYLVTGTG